METQTIVPFFIIIALCFLPSIGRTLVHSRKLRSIPTIGPSGFLTSYIGAVRFSLQAQEIVQEGYDKFRGSLFKIPTLTSWIVVVTGGQLIDEMRRAPDDILSAHGGTRELLASDVTMGPELFDDPFYIEAIKGPLTRNIVPKFADVQDEIIAAFDDFIPVKGDEWTKVTAYATVRDIVCRTSNRMFVGLPLCRNPDWLDLSKRFSIDIFRTAMTLAVFPGWLKPIVAPLLRSIPNGIRRATKHLEPLITGYLAQEVGNGKDCSEKPNDIISWMFDVTKNRHRTTGALVRGVLSVLVAAIHTSTMSFTFILYELAKRPEYVQPLRDEVETIIKEEGWSKNSVNKLQKMDSFIKECLRLSNMPPLAMPRKVLKDFTFSDGTTVPAGVITMVPVNSVHTDADNYPDPKTFDGFRFEKMHEHGSESLKYQFVTPGVDYVLFGHGRHACPGRFFVVNVMKIMLSHVLLNYDIKLPDEKGRQKHRQTGAFGGPDMTAKVLLRKRAKSHK